MKYEKMPDSTDILVRFDSTLVAGRLVRWPRDAYFVANSGVTFNAEQLAELSAKLQKLGAPDPECNTGDPKFIKHLLLPDTRD